MANSHTRSASDQEEMYCAEEAHVQWEYQEDVIFSKRSYIAPSRIIHAIVLSLIM